MKKLDFMRLIFFLLFSSNIANGQLEIVDLKLADGKFSPYFNALIVKSKDIAKFDAGSNSDILENFGDVATLAIDVKTEIEKNIETLSGTNRFEFRFKITDSSIANVFKSFPKYAWFASLSSIFAKAILVEFDPKMNMGMSARDKFLQKPKKREQVWTFCKLLLCELLKPEQLDNTHKAILKGYSNFVEKKIKEYQLNESTDNSKLDMNLGIHIPKLTKNECDEIFKLRKENKILKQIVVIGSPIIGNLVYVGNSFIKYNKKIAALKLICDGIQSTIPACSNPIRLFNPNFASKILPLQMVALVAVLIILRKNLF